MCVCVVGGGGRVGGGSGGGGGACVCFRIADNVYVAGKVPIRFVDTGTCMFTHVYCVYIYTDILHLHIRRYVAIVGSVIT